VRQHRRPPDWAACGGLRGGLKVLRVRHGKTSDATHRLTLSAVAVRQVYRIRAQSEAVIRVCTAQRRRSGGQARAERAPVHPVMCCVVALCVLARERHDRGLTIYKLKHQLRCQGRTVMLPALERLKQAA
jgi:hypothetical protein